MTDDPAQITAPFCSLPERDLSDRLAMIRREILPHVVRQEPCANGIRWRFENREPMRAKLEHLVFLERECCGEGVTFSLTDETEWLDLEVQGIPSERLERLLHSTPGTADGTGWRRALKAGGLGLGLSIAVFCGLPLVAVAVFGAAVAAPLVGLDNPVPIAAGAVVVALVAWGWARRRGAASNRRA